MLTVDQHMYVVLMGPEEAWKTDRTTAQRLPSIWHWAALYIIICPHPDNIPKLVVCASSGRQGNRVQKRWRAFPRSCSAWATESGSDPRLALNFGAGFERCLISWFLLWLLLTPWGCMPTVFLLLFKVPKCGFTSTGVLGAVCAGFVRAECVNVFPTPRTVRVVPIVGYGGNVHTMESGKCCKSGCYFAGRGDDERDQLF